MKKFVSICLILLCAVLAVSCGSAEKIEESDESAENVYLEMAEEYVNKGDFDAAADILQKGIDKTGSKALSEELKNVLEKQAKDGEKSNSDTQDSVKENGEATDVANVPAISKEELSVYPASWIENDPYYSTGEMSVYMDIGEDVFFNITYGSIETGAYTYVSHTVEYDDFVGNTVTFDYVDDFGNIGKAKVTFLSEVEINIEVTNANQVDKTSVYIRNGVYSLSPAYFGAKADDFEYDPNYEPEYTEPVYYDMSKASGILASMGLTEQQFREQCICRPIIHKYAEYVTYSSFDLLYAMNGNNVGGDNGMKIEKPTIDQLYLYARDYVGLSFYIPDFEIEYKNVYNGTPCYENYNMQYSESVYDDDFKVMIYDYRDDVHYPTISKSDNIDAFVIFLGVESNAYVDEMRFALISVEKIN